MSRNDPSRYYAALGLDQSATSDQIKKAFKSKAREFHPDRNRSPEATRQFQLINEAYQVLSDPGRRANYDSRCYGPEPALSPVPYTSDPVVCSVCRRVSAQPRYVIYRHVISAIFMTWRVVHQGIYCSECGAKKAYRASLKTWLLGWWGIPWGPIFSLHAIVSNLCGEQPVMNNFRFLGRQAIYFQQIERLELARAVAREALSFGNRLAEHERMPGSEMAGLTERLLSILGGVRADGQSLMLRNVWGVRSKAFKLQMGMAMCAAVAIAAGLRVANSNYRTAYRHAPPIESDQGIPPDSFDPTPPPSQPPAAVAKPAHRDIFDEVAAEPAFKEPAMPLPATGKMHGLWPVATGQVMAPLKVVTAAGSANYYVKLVDWQTHATRLVLFIRSGETATLHVPIGQYELRYATGAKWYGEEWLFGPETIYRKADERFDFRVEGDTLKGFTVELIRQVGGNLSDSSINPKDF
jgi:hypothetical protein